MLFFNLYLTFMDERQKLWSRFCIHMWKYLLQLLVIAIDDGFVVHLNRLSFCISLWKLRFGFTNFSSVAIPFIFLQEILLCDNQVRLLFEFIQTICQDKPLQRHTTFLVCHSWGWAHHLYLLIILHSGLLELNWFYG